MPTKQVEHITSFIHLKVFVNKKAAMLHGAATEDNLPRSREHSPRHRALYPAPWHSYYPDAPDQYPGTDPRPEPCADDPFGPCPQQLAYVMDVDPRHGRPSGFQISHFDEASLSTRRRSHAPRVIDRCVDMF